jgi:hypothetical protein
LALLFCCPGYAHFELGWKLEGNGYKHAVSL